MTSTISQTTSCLLPRAELSSLQRSEMFQLLSDHFAGVNREQFGHDLQEKNWIILLERNGRMVG
ncbi:MAG: hypothetical protein JWQ71_3406, partial [Pedosphaera sp.]|nr:hypothetical protein [Pedosphaera sp.]